MSVLEPVASVNEDYSHVYNLKESPNENAITFSSRMYNNINSLS